MLRLYKYLTALAVAALVVLFPAAVSAADGTGADVAGLETSLLALAPVVVFFTSLVLGRDASEAVKKLIPAAITVIMSAVYFLAQSSPELSGEMFASIGVLGAVANRLYEWVNAATKLAFGKDLNVLTGPGVVGHEAVGD